MAKLFVTRPRGYVDRLRAYRILIDGQVVTSIGPGSRVEIPLPPGGHQITARLDFLRSQPLAIEAGPEGVHHLRVGSNIDRRGPLRFVFYSTMFVPGAAPFLYLAGSRLFSDPLEAAWFTLFLAPLALLLSLLTSAVLVIWRDRILFLEEIAISDDDARRGSPPWSQLLRIRLTIRGLMVAVAILAILFGAGVEWLRFTRRGFYQTKARLHSQFEANFRDLEQKQQRLTAEFERTHHRASPISDRRWIRRPRWSTTTPR